MKILITERDILELQKRGIKVVHITKDTIITPLAADRIRTSKFTIVKNNNPENEITDVTDEINSLPGKKVVIGGDHTGFRIKNILIKYLSEKGYIVKDLGTFSEQSCDYPDYAKIVAESILQGKHDSGILIDATGIPSAIAANKFMGIRAATCYNTFSARSARAHNNANILVLGAKALGEETIKLILDEWLITKFEGGRHQNRLNKISEIENKNSE
jgi:ribose 5-phosphate isomerase B